MNNFFLLNKLILLHLKLVKKNRAKKMVDKNVAKVEERLSFVGIFTETFLTTCRESTANGLPNIFKNSNWAVKVFWAVLFGAGLGASVYCTVLTLKF